MMNTIVDVLFEDTDIATDVKELIEEKFVVDTTNINADLNTIQEFASELNTLLNG